jgi:hypothetical protein
MRRDILRGIAQKSSCTSYGIELGHRTSK